MLKLGKQLYSNTAASQRYGYKISETTSAEGTVLPVLKSDSDTTVTVYPPFLQVSKINWVNCNQSLIST